MSGKRVNKAQRKHAKQRKRKQRIQGKRLIEARRQQRAEAEIFSYRKESDWVQMPDLFPKEFSSSQRKAIIADVVGKAKAEVRETIPQLKSWFDEFDSTYIPSFYAYYFLSQKMGTTSEHEGDTQHYQHYLEILHAISLTKERNYSAQPLDKKAKDLEEQLSRLGAAIQFNLMDVTEEDTQVTLGRKMMIAQIRSHTAAIRNWAYYFQMEKVTTQLAASVNDEFKAKYGITSEELAKALFEVPRLTNEKFTEHRAKVRAMYAQKTKDSVIAEYEKQFPVNKMSSEESEKLFNAVGRKLSQLKIGLLYHSDIRLPDIYTVKLDEVHERGIIGDPEKYKKVFDMLSLSYGDLAEQNLEHIVLDNPVLQKPFIKLDEGTYFCPILGSIGHYTIEMIESLMADEQELADKYSDRKAKYCERYVAEILTKNFPNATVYQNISWQTKDNTSEVYETDNLLIAGPFALVIESKSGRLTPPGRRGAVERLQRHIDDLVLGPSRQANKLIQAIKDGSLTNIKNSHGNPISIDFSGTSYYIPIAITLENLGQVSHAREIVEAGMNKELSAEDISLSMTMTDLECIFDVLKLESMKLHYLVRRREFAMHVSFLGDEMDLLGFYLERGFNIGEDEFTGTMRMNLVMVSANVDKYFMLIDDEPIPPPEAYLTTEWEGLLSSLATRKPNGWVEASFALLNCDKADQMKFNKRVGKFIEDIKDGRFGKYPKNPYVVMTTGAEKRKTAIIVYPYKGLNRDERNKAIANILSDEGLNQCKIKLAFGIDVDDSSQPYSVMALTRDALLVEEPMEYIDYRS